MPQASANWVLLYDGVCALCNRLVLFVLARDRDDRFCFAALQSEFGRATLSRAGLTPDRLDTVVLVDPNRDAVFTRGAAVIRTLEVLGTWKWVVTLLRALPRRLVDFGYGVVARSRYRLFGRYDACPLPAPEHRHKFLG